MSERIRYDEDTMFKVHVALNAAGISGQQADDAVNAMQNAGILFRERDEGTTPESATIPLVQLSLTLEQAGVVVRALMVYAKESSITDAMYLSRLALGINDQIVETQHEDDTR
jgi:hypothetical protein